MKIYVFGAGASLGSQNPEQPLTSQSRAPLIDEIFSPRYKDLALHILSASELATFNTEIEKRPDKSVESWLEEQWNVIPTIPSTANKNSQTRLFGRKAMYLWNVLRMVSNSYDENNIYRLFLKNLSDENKDFGIINFNYDTLLDKAYQDVFHNTFLSVENYLEENFVKPHGSVNWLLKKRDDDLDIPSNHDTDLRIKMAMNQFFMNGSISITKLQVIDPMLEPFREPDIARVWERLGIDYFYPLVFLPLAQKNLDHINNFYEQVIGKGKDMLQEAEEIYVIGYRAKDDIIKELFKLAPEGTPLHVISNKNAETISKEIHSWAKNLGEGSILNGGFANFSGTHFKKPGHF